MSQHRRRRGARACRPGLEALERRRALAQFGVPWHDADHLTVSFVPDGTPVGAQASVLFQTLDALQPTAAWQGEILRAFQAWSVDASVNFGVRPDGGEPLGAPGPDQGDPRFGDIRIAAVPMSPEVVAISVPHDPFLSGTWSGDILLNSASPDLRPSDLLPIMLHEIGHVLGFDDSTDPDSVMFPHVDEARDALSPGDVASVQALYGVRDADPFEGDGGDDTLATAAALPTPSGFDGTTPLLVYANVSTATDADVYSFQAPAGYRGPATVRLQTAGVSLLASRLTVFDASGAEVADLSATGDVGDTLQYTLPRVVPGASYRVEVRGAAADAFGVGEYALAVNFDARSTATPAQIDALARQTYSYLSADDIAAIFRDPQGALFHDDHHADDSIATAEPLEPDGAYGSDAPVRITASLGDPSDVDFYRFETPADPASRPLVMTVTARATEVNGIMPGASVLDAQGDPVPALVLAHGDGTFTVQVADARPDSEYLVRVDGDPTSGMVVGNYDLDVEFGHEAADPTTFVASSLAGATEPSSYDLVVNQTQLFDFLLAPSSPGPGLGMTLADASGRVVASRSAGGGQTAGGDPVLLSPGVYRASFAVAGPGDGPAPPMAFLLYGASLTDPIGPALDDPTLNPMADATAGSFPPVIGSTDAPYFWLALGLSTPSATADPRAVAAPSGHEVTALAGTALPSAGLSGGPVAVVLVLPGTPGAAARRGDAAGPATAPTAAVAPAARVVAGARAPSSPMSPVVPIVPRAGADPADEEAQVPEGGVPGAGPVVLRTPPDAAGPDEPRPSPPSGAVADPPPLVSQDEGPSGPDRKPGEEARAHPDAAPLVAVVGIAAMGTVRAHSGRVGPGDRRSPRPSRARHPRGPRTIRPLVLRRG